MGDSWEREAGMNIKVLETSINNRQQYDISEIVSDLKWTTGLDSQPGSLSFSMLVDAKVFLRSGDIIEMIVDGKKLFKGKIFGRGKTKEAKWSVTAYDNLRYLKNEDTLLFGANTSSDRFKKICQTQGLPYKIINKSPYNCTPVIEDSHTYFSMIQDALDETRKGYGIRYAVWDNYGTLEHFDLNNKITKIVLGDNSLMTDYSFEASIDDAYNSVKVLREDKDKGKREIYTASHSGNIEKWGKLQMVETISDAELNASQLKKQANDLLKENNKETKTLDLESIGNINLRAGNSFILRLSDLKNDGIGNDSLALITKCSHNFGSEYSMSLEVEVVA